MKKTFKITSCFFIFLLSISNLISESSPFQSLRFNSSARASALAGCFVSISDDASALIYNPASISTVNNKPFSITFLKHVLDINSGNVSYIRKLEGLGTFAGDVSFTNYGSFIAADPSGKQTGTFSSNDLSIAATYSNELDTNLFYGVSLKYLFVNLDKSNSSAFALDAGLLYLIPKIRTNIGISVLHAGTQLSTFEGTTESLPLDIRIGGSHRLKGLPLLVCLSFHHLADNTDSFIDKFANFSIGGELYIGDYVQVRLGYDNQVRRFASPEHDRKLSGLTAGFGIKAKDFNFDYGISQVGVSATLHRFSLNLDL